MLVWMMTGCLTLARRSKTLASLASTTLDKWTGSHRARTRSGQLRIDWLSKANSLIRHLKKDRINRWSLNLKLSESFAISALQGRWGALPITLHVVLGFGAIVDHLLYGKALVACPFVNFVHLFCTLLNT